MRNINSKSGVELKKLIDKFLEDCGFAPLCEAGCLYKDECPDEGFDTSTEYYNKCLTLKDALKYFKKRFSKIIYANYTKK